MPVYLPQPCAVYNKTPPPCPPQRVNLLVRQCWSTWRSWGPRSFLHVAYSKRQEPVRQTRGISVASSKEDQHHPSKLGFTANSRLWHASSRGTHLEYREPGSALIAHDTRWQMSSRRYAHFTGTPQMEESPLPMFTLSILTQRVLAPSLACQCTRVSLDRRQTHMAIGVTKYSCKPLAGNTNKNKCL